MFRAIWIAVILAVASLSGCSETAAPRSVHSDRAEIREIFDRFAILADQGDVAAQMDLFTDDAVVISKSANGETTLQGKDEIEAAFSAFLSQFDTVFHQNGQQLVDVAGSIANATGYSIVVLGNDEGIMTMGVIYFDTYRRSGDRWLIQRRESDFRWTQFEPATATTP